MSLRVVGHLAARARPEQQHALRLGHHQHRVDDVPQILGVRRAALQAAPAGHPVQLRRLAFGVHERCFDLAFAASSWFHCCTPCFGCQAPRPDRLDAARGDDFGTNAGLERATWTFPSELHVRAGLRRERVREPHLPRRSAVHTQNVRARDNGSYASGSTRCDVQAVEAVQELHPAWRVARSARLSSLPSSRSRPALPGRGTCRPCRCRHEIDDHPRADGALSRSVIRSMNASNAARSPAVVTVPPSINQKA